MLSVVNGVSPVLQLRKVPVPVLSEILIFRLVVGPGLVDQQTPLRVTGCLPSLALV